MLMEVQTETSCTVCLLPSSFSPELLDNPALSGLGPSLFLQSA